MPTICVCSSKLKHREKIPDVEHRFMQICVARSVSKKEAAVTPEAMKAMDKEWDKLEKQAAWLLDKVREWKDVCQEAKANKTIVRVARVFGTLLKKVQNFLKAIPIVNSKE
jgi:hypothetical protein